MQPFSHTRISIMIAPDMNLFRQNLRRKLFETYRHVESQEGHSLSEKGAANIEISVYNYSLEEAQRQKIVKKWENRHFCQIYLDRMRSIYINLKNPEFLEKILNGEFKEQQVGFLSHHEMNPERWRLLMEQKMKRDQNSQGTSLSASTDMFTCRKCQSKKCVYYELQTRSADEPSTIFVTCLNCGKNWKQ